MLAAAAFVYGFPLVFDLDQVDRFVHVGMGSLPPGPLNAFSHAAKLAGPEETFVSINNDTVYSVANVDVSGGPVRMDVPDAAGRYYVLQFVDAWTNNFAYVGHRATGTEAGSFLLVPPGWTGTSRDATVIRFPTTVATIAGRWAVDGDQDIPAVARLQAQLTLIATGEGRGLPGPDPGVAEDIAFFEKLRVRMQAFPPAERDRAYQERFRPLGLFESESPYPDADPALLAALRDGIAEGTRQIEHAITHGDSPMQNGWHLTYHVFDYNLDFFELGALDDARWKLADTPMRYLARAGAARAGLLGNHGYEAAYAMVYNDGDGGVLNGANSYRLTFATPPPVGAFWSVTMYDTPDFFLVANPFDRYSIGDRTPGLHTAADGSLTIVMQHDRPGSAEDRANWLPTPAGAFRPILRMYEPHDAVFDGGYELPPVVRAG
jgi:hypothetical protein